MNIINTRPNISNWRALIWALSAVFAAECDGQQTPNQHRTFRYVAPGGPKPGDISAAGVCYATGDVVLAADDLGLRSATRTYSTEFCDDQGQCVGHGWRLNGLPQTSDATQLCRTTYSHYVTGNSERNGLTGDLKTAVRQSWDRSAWGGNDTYYYRYYTDARRAHLLKMALSPQGYQDAKAIYHDPTSSEVSDENLLRFSRSHYEYDTDRRVVKAK